jgi:hypothetical protein
MSGRLGTWQEFNRAMGRSVPRPLRTTDAAGGRPPLRILAAPRSEPSATMDGTGVRRLVEEAEVPCSGRAILAVLAGHKKRLLSRH